MKTFVIATLGCRVNQSESETLEEILQCTGLSPFFLKGGADLCIINTCSVTSRAAIQSRQAVRRMIRSHPGARIIVTGCHAQVASDEMRAIPGVHAVVRQSEKEQIPEMVAAINGDNASYIDFARCAGMTPTFSELSAHPHFNTRARPYLKIQDGCNAHCTYCIVPRTRGPSRSRPPENILKRLIQLKATGYPEAVLTGIHLGSYGCDFKKPLNLLDLIRQIETIQAIHRIRLSSIEPNEMTDALIEFAAASKNMRTLVCPHFHLPLQSGDDEILKRMRRPYTRELYRDRVHKVLTAMPEAAIGADVMVAFPGETESSFERTFSFIEALPLAYLHVFPFSPRPGTPAARFDSRVTPQAVKARCRRLRELGRAKRLQFYSIAKGRSVDLVMEKGAHRRIGYSRGISETYIPVWLKSESVPTGRFAKARIRQVDAYLTVFGSVL